MHCHQSTTWLIHLPYVIFIDINTGFREYRLNREYRWIAEWTSSSVIKTSSSVAAISFAFRGETEATSINGAGIYGCARDIGRWFRTEAVARFLLCTRKSAVGMCMLQVCGITHNYDKAKQWILHDDGVRLDISRNWSGNLWECGIGVGIRPRVHLFFHKDEGR